MAFVSIANDRYRSALPRIKGLGVFQHETQVHHQTLPAPPHLVCRCLGAISASNLYKFCIGELFISRTFTCPLLPTLLMTVKILEPRPFPKNHFLCATPFLDVTRTWWLPYWPCHCNYFWKMVEQKVPAISLNTNHPCLLSATYHSPDFHN